MSPEPLRVALVGYGLAGAVLHAPLIDATEGLSLTSVVTRDGERRARLARERPGVVAVDTLDDALATADLVVVAAANRVHVSLAAAALAAGCHVVVDKPLAVTGDEAKALATRAREAGLVLAVFHNRRWDDDFLTLRREVAAGSLGEILVLESRFDRWRPQARPGAWRELGDPADGGGLLLDLGTHLADQAVVLLGPVTQVYAELDARRPGAVVEDEVFLALTHAGGARSHLWAGVHAAHAAPRLRAIGTRATFVSEGLDPQEPALRDGAHPGDDGFGRRDPERAATLHDGEQVTRVAMERGDWGAFYGGVVAAVRAGAPAPVTADDAVVVLGILDAARASAASGTVVHL